MTPVLTAPALARDLTGAERSALSVRIDTFAEAMRAKEIGEVISVTPPRIIAHIAKQAGVDPAELRKMVVKQTEEVMKDVTFEKMSMRIDQAEYKTTPDGEPYALIPTSFVMDAGDAGKFETNSHTLALLDAGKWYLIRVNDAGQLAILRQVYPGFVGIEFPKGTMKAIK